VSGGVTRQNHDSPAACLDSQQHGTDGNSSSLASIFLEHLWEFFFSCKIYSIRNSFMTVFQCLRRLMDGSRHRSHGNHQCRISVCGCPGQDHYWKPLPTLRCYNLPALRIVIITKYTYIFCGGPLVLEAPEQLPSSPPGNYRMPLSTVDQYRYIGGQLKPISQRVMIWR